MVRGGVMRKGRVSRSVSLLICVGDSLSRCLVKLRTVCRLANARVNVGCWGRVLGKLGWCSPVLSQTISALVVRLLRCPKAGRRR